MYRWSESRHGEGESSKHSKWGKQQVAECSLITKSTLFIYKEFPKGFLKITINEKIFKEEKEVNHFNSIQ